jgi:hypothetical protein
MNYKIWNAGAQAYIGMGKKDKMEHPTDDEIVAGLDYHGNYTDYSLEWGTQKLAEGMKEFNVRTQAIVDKRVIETGNTLRAQMTESLNSAYKSIDDNFDPLYVQAIESSPEATEIRAKYSYIISNLYDEEDKQKFIQKYNDELAEIPEVKEVLDAHQNKINDIKQTQTLIWQQKFDNAYDVIRQETTTNHYKAMGDWIEDNFIAGYNSQYGVRDWVAENLYYQKHFQQPSPLLHIESYILL